MIEPIRGLLVMVDGVWMVNTPEGLVEPNSAEMMMEGVPHEEIIKSDRMSPSEYQALLQNLLKEVRRTSSVSDEEYEERMRREGLKP